MSNDAEIQGGKLTWSVIGWPGDCTVLTICDTLFSTCFMFCLATLFKLPQLTSMNPKATATWRRGRGRGMVCLLQWLFEAMVT